VVGSRPRAPDERSADARGSDELAKYAVLEMDDTVIGSIAQQAGKSFTFVRNVSDPVVPTGGHDGKQSMSTPGPHGRPRSTRSSAC
jgi:hypothetical protein